MRRVPANVARDWRLFLGAVAGRLAAGQRVYGDRSLLADPPVLAGEIEDEALDIAGWAFLLWRRLRVLQRRLATRERRELVARVARPPAAARRARRPR